MCHRVLGWGWVGMGGELRADPALFRVVDLAAVRSPGSAPEDRSGCRSSVSHGDAVHILSAMHPFGEFCGGKRAQEFLDRGLVSLEWRAFGRPLGRCRDAVRDDVEGDQRTDLGDRNVDVGIILSKFVGHLRDASDREFRHVRTSPPRGRQASRRQAQRPRCRASMRGARSRPADRASRRPAGRAAHRGRRTRGTRSCRSF